MLSLKSRAGVNMSMDATRIDDLHGLALPLIPLVFIRQRVFPPSRQDEPNHTRQNVRYHSKYLSLYYCRYVSWSATLPPTEVVGDQSWDLELASPTMSFAYICRQEAMVTRTKSSPLRCLSSFAQPHFVFSHVSCRRPVINPKIPVLHIH